MKHRDIRKFRDYWNFLNVLANRQEQGEPFDETTVKVFADWLAEHGDAREHIARNATRDFLSDTSFGGIDQPHPMDPIGATGEPRPVRGSGGWPLEAYKDNVSTYSALYKQIPWTRPFSPREASGYPIIHWRIHVPRTVSTTRKERTVRLTAPVTVEQLHQFIDAMPNSKTKAQWKTAAKEQGWVKPEEPIRLAAIPGEGQGSVLVRVPMPEPVQTAKPPTGPVSPAPVEKPKAQPVFILPQ